MTPDELLETAMIRATASLDTSLVANEQIRENIAFVSQCISNRAGVRLMLACLLAKLDQPSIDPRKPYTEINSRDSFSGRAYDERYISPFITKHRLPCNSTTAFLTPTLRNQNKPLTVRVKLVGRPRELYEKTLQLLEDVALTRISADLMIAETLRVLVNMRNANFERMNSLIESLRSGSDSLPISSEAVVTLLKQHLACKNSSRLPVLMVAAAYHVVGEKFAERIVALNVHNAADLQTGAIGDVEICLANEERVVTAYEMKMKLVTIEDIDVAATKIARADGRVDNYIFITTDAIDPQVRDYAASFYERTGGTEIAILDCLGFVRHFVHFFHRLRGPYLDAYQDLVLLEPDSSVGQALKEAFLALRKAAEAD